MTDWLVRLFVKEAANGNDPAVHARCGKLAGWVGIVCNTLLAAAKLAAGFLSGSIAIMADAVNNFSDAASSVITLAGFKLSEKPADEEHPFGHARFEYIAGLAVAVLVMVIGIELGKSSVEKILHPTPVDFSAASLLALAAAIAVKLWMAAFNRRIGRRIGSVSLQAAFVDSRNDVVATAAILAAGLAARFTGLALDGWMGAAVAVFILVSGFSLVKDTLDPLLGAAPDRELVRRLSEKISAYEGVLGTHDLLVHDYGPARRFASAHVEMDSGADVLESHDVIDRIERDVLEEDGIHLIIHHDPVPTGHAANEGARGWVLRQLAAVDGRLRIHDFRRVEAEEYVEYIFDVAAPEDFALSGAGLAARLQGGARGEPKPVRMAVTVDRSYAPIPPQREHPAQKRSDSTKGGFS